MKTGGQRARVRGSFCERKLFRSHKKVSSQPKQSEAESVMSYRSKFHFLKSRISKVQIRMAYPASAGDLRCLRRNSGTQNKNISVDI